MKKKRRLPHHGRGGSKHIGRTRTKLAQIISDSLDIDCQPEDLMPATGRHKNNTCIYDSYAWEMFTATKTGIPIVYGSFDTMTECVKAGQVELTDGEIHAKYK